MTFRLILTALAAGAAIAAPAQFQFSTRGIPIHAGVLLIESQRTPDNRALANPTPHVWANLDQLSSLKPAGWVISNPRAAGAMTQAMFDQWSVINGVGSPPPPVGTRLTKRDAGYWQVRLAEASDEQLSEYEVLSLTLATGISLNPSEREKLRRYVDQGGVLWVDVLETRQFIDAANGVPLPFMLGTSAQPLNANLLSPLLNVPNAITLSELNFIQGGRQGVARPLVAGDFGSIAPIQSGAINEANMRDAVVGVSDTLTTVSAGRVGDGYVVVTTRGLSQILNRAVFRVNGVDQVDDVNGRFIGGAPLVDGATAVAAKLVANVVSLPSSYASIGQGSRKTGGSPVDIAAPLMKRFEGRSGDPFDETKPPVIFRGRVVAVQDSRVVVLDAGGGDLNGDGNPDDGVQGGLADTVDLVWRSESLGGSVSAATCATIPDSDFSFGGRRVVDMIFVTTGRGEVLVFDLDSAPSQAVAPVARLQAPDPSLPSDPMPVTVHEGLVYVADVRQSDQSGRIWAFDARTLREPNGGGGWSIDRSPRLRAPSAAPTVGYVPIQDNSGGVDKVAYLPTRPGGGGIPAGLTSVWIGVRGEKPVSVARNGALLRVETRALLQGLPIVATGRLGIKVSVIDKDGNALTTGELQDLFIGSATQTGTNGVIDLPLTAAGALRNWEDDSRDDKLDLRIDYFIDWGQATSNQSPPDAYIRGNLELPDSITVARQVIGNVALSPNGIVFLATANPSSPADGGTLFALREEGRGEFKLVYRWDLFNGSPLDQDRFSFRYNNAGGITESIKLPPAIVDEDSLVKSFPPLSFLDRPLRNLTFRGGPSVRGDTVYISARGEKNLFGPITTECTVLLAFEANPNPTEFELTNVPAGFAILQPDPARSQNKTEPETFSVLQAGQFTYDTDTGTNRGRLRLSNMMAVTRGRVRDAISTSLPIIIRRGGQGDILVEPELSTGQGDFVAGLAAGRWTPLRWYTVFQGLDPRGQPLVTGSTMYVAGSSRFPDLIRFGFSRIPQPNGLLYGMDAEISPNDPFLRTNTARPWQAQLNQVDFRTSDFVPNPAIRWPQMAGLGNLENNTERFSAFRVRLLQNTLPEPTAFGVVGGDSVLVTWGQNGIYGFQRADFLIADEGRAGRFDSNGNPIWTTDQTQKAGQSVPVSGIGVGRTVSTPVRVYPSGQGTYWVVDPGADRISRIDSAGRELRTITEFKVHPRFRPDGFNANNPTRLVQPRDVLVYETRRTQSAANRVFGDATTDELWVHYVIADTGNFRIVELVDRLALDAAGRVLGPVSYVDPTSDKPGQVERALGVLFWHTPSELSGKQYAYNSIERVFVPGTGFQNVPVIAFGFGNSQPGRSTFGLDTVDGSGNLNRRADADQAGGTGGIVIFRDGRPSVITRFDVPPIAANVLYNEETNRFESPARPRSSRTIQGLRSVTMRYVDDPRFPGRPFLAIMLADAGGVWEIVQDATSVNEERWIARFALPNGVYTATRRRLADDVLLSTNPLQLDARFARRLDSGEVLVVNGYVGRKRPDGAGRQAPFSGEIVLFDGTIRQPLDERGFAWNIRNLGFDSLSVKYELPPVDGTRSIISPVFADRR
jgi:hypothetical protein